VQPVLIYYSPGSRLEPVLNWFCTQDGYPNLNLNLQDRGGTEPGLGSG